MFFLCILDGKNGYVYDDCSYFDQDTNNLNGRSCEGAMRKKCATCSPPQDNKASGPTCFLSEAYRSRRERRYRERRETRAREGSAEAQESH